MRPEQCSQEVLDTIPLVMRTIREEMRRQHQPDLSVPQFRTLAVLSQCLGASLSQAAAHVGLTLSAMSRTIEGLVERGLVTRDACPDDRRRVGLALTTEGASILEAARKATQARLAELLGQLSDGERTVIVEAMRALQGAFSVRPREDERKGKGSMRKPLISRQ
jgi:DNA-binding MarR family transcriptional regulator